MTLEERFWAKVDRRGPNECWEWTAHKGHGYGRISRGGGVVVKAHRLSWEFRHGQIPDGMHVYHHCDNPSCVNPAHLFLGTDADNVADMYAKGRNKPLRGVENGRAKLCHDDILEIRNSVEEGKLLADKFGVSPSTVSRIRKGEKWRHIQ